MIDFYAEDIPFVLPDQELMANWLIQVARAEQAAIAQLTYVFCSDEYLVSLNQEFLNHDYFTDVITFDQRDDAAAPIEGDIFISYDRVTENAQQMNVSFLDELSRVMVHGLLHLLGFGDFTPAEKQSMRSAEDYYLDSFREITKQCST